MNLVPIDKVVLRSKHGATIAKMDVPAAYSQNPKLLSDKFASTHGGVRVHHVVDAGLKPKHGMVNHTNN